MQFWPPDDQLVCSKHVEAWNKLIVKQKFCASSWLITETNILRCMVSKTSKKYIYIYVTSCEGFKVKQFPKTPSIVDARLKAYCISATNLLKNSSSCLSCKIYLILCNGENFEDILPWKVKPNVKGPYKITSAYFLQLACGGLLSRWTM